MSTDIQHVRDHLLASANKGYQVFQSKLLPTLPPDRVIGVRIPVIRTYAKQLAGTPAASAFLASLPHDYYDENNLHAALIEHIEDFDLALEAVEQFLPYIDNWATCDGFCPKCLRKELQRLFPSVKRWLASDHPYTVRFALVRLTAWYLDAPIFTPEILELAASVKSDEYYVNMAVAWFFSIALVKQYSATLPYLTAHRLPMWVHNKAIQKAVESYRPSAKIKSYLKTLKRREADADGGTL